MFLFSSLFCRFSSIYIRFVCIAYNNFSKEETDKKRNQKCHFKNGNGDSYSIQKWNQPMSMCIRHTVRTRNSPMQITKIQKKIVVF